jgi:hypothetical protein
VQGSAPGGRLFAIGHPTVGTYLAVSNIDVIQVQIRRTTAAIELTLTGRSPARLAVPA